MSDLVRLERDAGIAVVTLNRPETMNALSRALRAELYQIVTGLADDRNVRALVLTGAGERAFTAGLDLKELGTDTEMFRPESMADAEQNPVRAIELLPQPVIGAINGVAITGGFELALACDILVASTNARFADTHARVGILPGWGLSQKLSRMLGISRAKELSLTGNFIDAETAEHWGLVNRVVAPENLMDEAMRLARDASDIDAKTAQQYKHLIDAGFALPFGEAIALEDDFSAKFNSAVTPEEVEARRKAVQARGRSQ